MTQAPVAPSAPAGARYLLPPAAYTGGDWWRRERSALFARTWQLLGPAEELPHRGCYSAVEAGAYPLLLVRDGGGALRAFHNLCRHRGMVLLAGRGALDGPITCSYHRWRYGLDGTLAGVPQRRAQFPDLDPDRLGLLPASVEVWEGLAFVHPDPDPPPLAAALEGIADGLGSVRPGRLVPVARAAIEVACNWKLLIENHVDVYHLWYLHEASLGDYDHPRFTHRRTGANWTSFEPLRSGRAPGGGGLAHLDDRDRGGIGAHLVFPNLMVAVTAELFATYVARPVAPERTVVELHIRADPGADGDRLLATVRSFLDEDIRACEAVAAGMRSPAFSVGPLAASHEAPIVDFQRSVLDALDAVAAG